ARIRVPYTHSIDRRVRRVLRRTGQRARVKLRAPNQAQSDRTEAQLHGASLRTSAALVNSGVCSLLCETIVATGPNHSAMKTNVRVTGGSAPTVRVSTDETRCTWKVPNGVFKSPAASTLFTYDSV